MQSRNLLVIFSTCFLHVLIQHTRGYLISLSPVNTTAALGTNATFSCEGNSNITWEIANRQIRNRDDADEFRTLYKIYVPLPKPNFSELIITASSNTNSTSIICLVGPSNGFSNQVTESEEAIILAYGEPFPPYNLTIVADDLSLVAMWSEPFSLEGEELSYVISITNLAGGMPKEVIVNTTNYIPTKQDDYGQGNCTPYLFTIFSKNGYSRSSNAVSSRKEFPAVPLVLQRHDIEINVLLLNKGVNATIKFNSSTDPCSIYPVSSYKFHITDWYTNRSISITTRTSELDTFILDGSNGLARDQVYLLVVEAVNNIGSTFSEQVQIYTTGLQPATSSVMEVNGSVTVTCTFATGATSTGCQVTIFTRDSLREVISRKIIRPHGSSVIEDTLDISGLVEESTLVVQVAELLSGGDVSRALLNKTITVDVPLISMQESKGGGISSWILGVAVAVGVVIVLLVATLIVILIYCSYRMTSNRKAHVELDPDYELTPNDTYGISINIEIAPDDTSRIHTDGIKAMPNAVYGLDQRGEHLEQEVCSKLDDTDSASVLSAYVAMQPNVYETIDCLKQI